MRYCFFTGRICKRSITICKAAKGEVKWMVDGGCCTLCTTFRHYFYHFAALVVGIYDENMKPEEAATAVEKMADYLAANNA